MPPYMSPREDRFAQHAHRFGTVLFGRPVDDEDAVEVVRLVLDDARMDPFGLESEWPPANV